jgi:hypothetical protein
MSVKTLALHKTKTVLLDSRQEKECKVNHLKEALFVG